VLRRSLARGDRRLGGWIAVACLLAAELALVALAAAHRDRFIVPASKYTFASWLMGPLGGVAGWMPRAGHGARELFLLLLLVMCAGYLVVLAVTRELSPRMAIVAIVAAHLLILLSPPLRLTDVFTYIDYARLGVIHGINPYVHPPAAARHDHVFVYASWRHQATPYGPLFTLASYPLGWLKITQALWVLKLTTVAASLGCVALIAGCARRLGRDPRMPALAFGLNPLLLVYGLGGVHNDFFMALLLIAGIYLLLSLREAQGLLAVVASAAVKISSAPLVPFMLLGARDRRAALGWFAAIALLGVALTVAVFGVHTPGLTQQSNVVTRYSVPHLFGDLFGISAGKACTEHALKCPRGSLQWVGLAAFVGAFAFLLWRVWRGADWLTGAGWCAIALILTLTSVMPWYLVWVLPLAVLGRSRRLLWATVAVALYLLVTSWPADTFLFHVKTHRHIHHLSA
jgi:hypothetical protein